MAICSQCTKDVGCGCNLIQGFCPTCYSKLINAPGDNGLGELLAKKQQKKEKYKKPVTDAPPVNGMTEILHTSGISKEEKLKRINEILERARQTYLT